MLNHTLQHQKSFVISELLIVVWIQLFRKLNDKKTTSQRTIKKYSCSFVFFSCETRNIYKTEIISFSLKYTQNNTVARGVMRRLILSLCGYYYVNVVCHHNQDILIFIFFSFLFFVFWFDIEIRLKIYCSLAFRADLLVWYALKTRKNLYYSFSQL